MPCYEMSFAHTFIYVLVVLFSLYYNFLMLRGLTGTLCNSLVLTQHQLVAPLSALIFSFSAHVAGLNQRTLQNSPQICIQENKKHLIMVV